MRISHSSLARATVSGEVMISAQDEVMICAARSMVFFPMLFPAQAVTIQLCQPTPCGPIVTQKVTYGAFQENSEVSQMMVSLGPKG